MPILLIVLLLVFRSSGGGRGPAADGRRHRARGARPAAAQHLRDADQLARRRDRLDDGAGAGGRLRAADGLALPPGARRREPSIDAAIATAAHAAGRTIVFAGGTLALAMLTAALVAPGDLLGSVAAGVMVSALLSVLLAVSLMPALLACAGGAPRPLASTQPGSRGRPARPGRGLDRPALDRDPADPAADARHRGAGRRAQHRPSRPAPAAPVRSDPAGLRGAAARDRPRLGGADRGRRHGAQGRDLRARVGWRRSRAGRIASPATRSRGGDRAGLPAGSRRPPAARLVMPTAVGAAAARKRAARASPRCAPGLRRASDGRRTSSAPGSARRRAGRRRSPSRTREAQDGAARLETGLDRASAGAQPALGGARSRPARRRQPGQGPAPPQQRRRAAGARGPQARRNAARLAGGSCAPSPPGCASGPPGSARCGSPPRWRRSGSNTPREELESHDRRQGRPALRPARRRNPGSLGAGRRPGRCRPGGSRGRRCRAGVPSSLAAAIAGIEEQLARSVDSLALHARPAPTARRGRRPAAGGRRRGGGRRARRRSAAAAHFAAALRRLARGGHSLDRGLESARGGGARLAGGLGAIASGRGSPLGRAAERAGDRRRIWPPGSPGRRGR